MRLAHPAVAIALATQPALAQQVIAMDARPSPQPVVEVEEEVYSFEPADNGADPMWCYGSTCLVRIGDDVFASGLETLKDAKPLNNVRWMLFRRAATGWELQQVDETGRTREPCPVAGFLDGRLFLSANPTLVEDPQAGGGGPARPEVLEFSATDPQAPYSVLLPAWEGEPRFTEHTYRTFAADGPRGELILLNNVGYTHSEWAFRDSEGGWTTGQLPWPPIAEGEVEPYGADRARCNYPNVVLEDRAVHFCGAAAYDNWDRVHTADLMGRQKWGSRWRRLYYTWTPDITGHEFRPWIEIANTFADGGWLFPGDMWVDAERAAHILWFEHPIHQGLRDQHFPDIKRTYALKYAVMRDGEVVLRRTLAEGGEGLSGEIPGNIGSSRVQITPDGRTFMCCYMHGTDAEGNAISENRLMEILPDGSTADPIPIALEHPMNAFFTTTPRGGSPPSTTLDMLGRRAGGGNTICYARVRLW
jgi:hypothetical protein